MSASECFGKLGKRNLRQPLSESKFMASVQSTIIGQHQCKKNFYTGSTGAIFSALPRVTICI